MVVCGLQITQRVQQWEAPHVPASLDLPEETHVDLYNRECVRKNEAEEELMPFTMLLLGNLRSFPLMMHPLERLVCQYHYRRWLIVAAVAERVQVSGIAKCFRDESERFPLALAMRRIIDIHHWDVHRERKGLAW